MHRAQRELLAAQGAACTLEWNPAGISRMRTCAPPRALLAAGSRKDKAVRGFYKAGILQKKTLKTDTRARPS
jgi:hypothetical protein